MADRPCGIILSSVGICQIFAVFPLLAPPATICQMPSEASWGLEPSGTILSVTAI